MKKELNKKKTYNKPVLLIKRKKLAAAICCGRYVDADCGLLKSYKS